MCIKSKSEQTGKQNRDKQSNRAEGEGPRTVQETFWYTGVNTEMSNMLNKRYFSRVKQKILCRKFTLFMLNKQRAAVIYWLAEFPGLKGENKDCNVYDDDNK